MNVEHPSTGLHPFVEVYEIEADGRVGKPTVLLAGAPIGTMGRKSTPALVIVSGPLSSPRAQEQALRIVRQERQGVLFIAVFQVTSGTCVPADVHQVLCTAYHAVLVATDRQPQQLIDRLVQTITTLGGDDRWLVCDWDDICHMVGRPGGTGLARYGSGCRAGPGRAATATIDAITQIESHGFQLCTARGICIGVRSSSKELYGKEIKEVLNQLRAVIDAGVTVTLSVGSSRALEPSVLEVDIFAFGERSPEEIKATNGSNGVADPIDATALAWAGENAALDPLYPHARSLVLSEQRASISLIQRHFHIGYGRASRLLDALEVDVVSTKDDDGRRKVLTLDSAL